jgi:biotin synthase
MKFNSQGQIVDFGIPKGQLEEVIESGLPFTTSGCPGCNRPYANERPSEEPRNYPYIPRGKEIERIKKELIMYREFKNNIDNLRNYLKVRCSTDTFLQ